MNFKKTNAAVTTVTRNTSELEEGTDNIYESTVILAKRANQIGKAIKEELTQKLNEFATNTDNLEEIFENREQIEISKFYESIPKPPAIAIQEFSEGGVFHRMPEEGDQASSEEE